MLKVCIWWPRLNGILPIFKSIVIDISLKKPKFEGKKSLWKMHLASGSQHRKIFILFIILLC